MWKWKWLGDEDYVEVHSEDLDAKQDISSEESEDELDKNEEHFIFGKDKESKWSKNTRTQISQTQKNAETEFEIWKCFITNNILDLILLYTNKCIDSILNQFTQEIDVKQIHKPN